MLAARENVAIPQYFVLFFLFLLAFDFCWLLASIGFLASVGFWLCFCLLLPSVGFLALLAFWFLLAFGFCWFFGSVSFLVFVGFWFLLALASIDFLILLAVQYIEE